MNTARAPSFRIKPVLNAVCCSLRCETLIVEFNPRQTRTNMTELCQFKVGVKVAPWPILGRKLANLATFLIYGLLICCAHHLH